MELCVPLRTEPLRRQCQLTAQKGLLRNFWRAPLRYWGKNLLFTRSGKVGRRQHLTWKSSRFMRLARSYPVADNAVRRKTKYCLLLSPSHASARHSTKKKKYEKCTINASFDVNNKVFQIFDEWESQFYTKIIWKENDILHMGTMIK